MTEERRRILELVRDGKLTVEQADLLMAELERPKPLRDQLMRGVEKARLDELKQIGSQVTAAVTQSLSDVRRTVEQQLDSWNLGLSQSVVSATSELHLDEEVDTVSVETRNGRIQINSWDGPGIRIHVRGQVRTDSLSEAKRTLDASLQTERHDGTWQLTVLQGGKEGVMGAHIDVYLPNKFAKFLAKTQSGAIHADSVQVGELQLDAVNGSIWLHQADAERIRLNAENGSIELHNSVSVDARSVYVATKNGRIVIDGMAPALHCVGTARTVNGRILISGERLTAEMDEGPRPTHARFEQSPASDSDGAPEVHVYCETRNGEIRVRS